MLPSQHHSQELRESLLIRVLARPPCPAKTAVASKMWTLIKGVSIETWEGLITWFVGVVRCGLWSQHKE
jgi:hypothetical protein